MERFIRVRTEEEAKQLMVEAEKQGYFWQSGDLPTELMGWWEVYENDTTLCLEDLKIGKFLTYGHASYLNEGVDEELLLQEFLSKEF